MAVTSTNRVLIFIAVFFFVYLTAKKVTFARKMAANSDKIVLIVRWLWNQYKWQGDNKDTLKHSK